MKSDREIRDEMVNRLNLEGESLVREIVNTHRQNAELKAMQFAVWVNANEDPWDKGVTLLEVAPEALPDPEQDFRVTEFKPTAGWPRLRLILANRKDSATERGQVFVRELIQKMNAGQAKTVFRSSENEDAAAVLNQIMAGA